MVPNKTGTGLLYSTILAQEYQNPCLHLTTLSRYILPSLLERWSQNISETEEHEKNATDLKD